MLFIWLSVYLFAGLFRPSTVNYFIACCLSHSPRPASPFTCWTIQEVVIDGTSIRLFSDKCYNRRLHSSTMYAKAPLTDIIYQLQKRVWHLQHNTHNTNYDQFKNEWKKKKYVYSVVFLYKLICFRWNIHQFAHSIEKAFGNYSMRKHCFHFVVVGHFNLTLLCYLYFVLSSYFRYLSRSLSHALPPQCLLHEFRHWISLTYPSCRCRHFWLMHIGASEM